MKIKKNCLWIIGLVALVIPVVTLSGCYSGIPSPGSRWTNLPATAQVNISNQQTGIWISGEGKVTAVPDIATLRLGIEAQMATVAEAQAKATEAMNRVMTALEDNGVAEKDIQTQYFSIYKVTRWDETRVQEIVIGYRVNNVVTAKIRDIEKAGLIIDAVVAAGGDLTRIDNITFSIDDPTAYFDEARDKAMADAKAKAERLAELAGVRLGKPTYVSEGLQMPPIIYPEARMEIPVPAPAPAPPPISPGEMEISLTLQVAYAILD
jgi:uncharacterized protein YggE